MESLGKESILKLRSYYIVPFPDGSEFRIESEEFQVTITSEYYSVSLEQSGSSITNIDVTSSDAVKLNVVKIIKDGTSTIVTTPVILEILDDISGEVVYTGSNFNPANDTLPTSITKKIGVYRMIIRDAVGISGEFTFAVQSGVLSQVRIVPISSALVKGATTVAMVRLLDRLGNPTSPNLHTLKLDITG